MKAQIVVGLGYGDEGKGITTDYLANKSVERTLRSCVVRYSGGQQAGHTVIKNDVKHIYGSFAAGAQRGLDSYFSEFTTFYPLYIYKEEKLLRSKSINANLIIHPLAKMTTPYDCFANRRCEQTNKDGTCGMGIGKTIERNLSGQHQLFAIDLLNKDVLHQKLNNIKNLYYNIQDLTNQELREVDEFYTAIDEIVVKIRNYDCLKGYDNLIFEGSQGVLLDMDHGVYPNVTWSNTTSKNAHLICDKLNIKEREMYYVTRCYHTRHGNGIFKQTPIVLKNNDEEINVNNEWQGEFKISKLDYSLLNHAINIDKIYSNGNSTSDNLVVTCLDQVEDFNKINYSQIPFYFERIYESFSPDSKNFKQIINI